MKLNKGLTPYPILRDDTDDFIRSKFYATVIPKVELDTIHFHIEIHLEHNRELLNDLQRGILKYAVQIESPSTAFRKEYIQSDAVFNIDVPDSELGTPVEVRTLIIVAADNGYVYTNKHFHKDYSGISFTLTKGNIIADWGTIIELNKDNVDTSKLNSVIKVRFAKMDNNFLDVLMDNEYLIVKIDEKYKDMYCSLGQEIYKQTFLSLIMVPAMEFVLLRMKECGDEGFEDYTWFRAVSAALLKNGIDIEQLSLNNDNCSVLNVAQMIFANPIKRAFEELNSRIEERKE